MYTQYVGLTFGMFIHTQPNHKTWLYECILLNPNDEAYKDLDVIVYTFTDLSEALCDANKIIVDEGGRCNRSSFTYIQAYMNTTHYLNNETLYINDQQFNVKNECVVIR